MKKLTRRKFIGAAAVAGATIATRRIWAGEAPAILTVKNPNSKLQLGVIGLGGISGGHLRTASTEEHLVALCDCHQHAIDKKLAYIGELEEKNVQPADMAIYLDYREMLADLGDKLDAVEICTPDHNHAIISIDAMKAGKHVLTEKPMAHNIHECHALREAGRKYRVATQQGNERHSADYTRQRVEALRAGAIGPVHEVYYWTSRAHGGSDQGIEISKLKNVNEPFRLWSVPVHEDEAYLSYRQQPNPGPLEKWQSGWRGDRRWGTGSLGDWGAHLVDEAYWALKFDQAPKFKIETLFRRGGGEQHHYKTSIYKWTIPERADMPEVTAYWYDGLMPNEDPNLKDDDGKPLAAVQNLPPPLKKLIAEYGDRFGEHGTMFIGEKGFMVQGRILPDSVRDAVGEIPKTLPRAKGNNDTEWFHAIRTGEPSSCNFDYSAGMVEHFLSGILSDGVPVGEVIEYDAVNHRVSSHPELNARLTRRYREGYEI